MAFHGEMTQQGREDVITRTQSSGDPLTLRRHLEVYLHAAENRMRNGLANVTDEMWTRGYYEARKYREQIVALDAAMGGVL